MTDALGLVIFDCDGVLVDTERIAVRIDIAVLAELGWVMTEADVVERFMGRTDEYMVSQIEAYLGRPLPAKWEEPFQRWYRDAFDAELTPVPGIVEALDEIATTTCVASSGTHEHHLDTPIGLIASPDQAASRDFAPHLERQFAS